MLCNSQGTTTDVPGGLEAEPRARSPPRQAYQPHSWNAFRGSLGQPPSQQLTHRLFGWPPWPGGLRLKFAINEKSSGFSRKRPRDRRCLSQLRLQANVTKTSPWAWLQTEQVSSRDTQACAPAIHTCHTPHRYISLSLSL